MSDPSATPVANPAKKKSFGKTAKLSAAWDFGGRLTSQSTMFIVSIFLARLLSPGDFGITAAAKFFVSMAARLTQLGLNVSLVRMKDMRPEHASSVFVMNLLMGVLAYAGLYFASPWIGRYFASPEVGRVIPVTATAFLIAPFGTVPAAMLNRHLQYRSSTVIQILDGVAGTVMSLVLALLNFGYWSIVFGALSGTVISTAAKFYLSPWRPSFRFSVQALRETIGFGVGFQTKRLLQYAGSNLDNVVVGRTLGIISLGFYDKAFGLMLQLTDRFAFDNALMRIFSVINDEPDRFRRALVRGMSALTLLICPVLAFAAIAAEPIIVTLLGPKWLPSVGPFRVLALAGILRSLLRPMSAANESLGLVWRQTGQELLFIAVMLTGVAVGSRWGVTGAAMGVLPGLVVNLMVSVRLLTRYTTVTAGDLWSAVSPALSTVAVMGICVLTIELTLNRFLGPPPWLLLIAMGLTAGMVYAAGLLWTPFPLVASIVRESVDDLTPWVRGWVPLGVLRPRAAVQSSTDR